MTSVSRPVFSLTPLAAALLLASMNVYAAGPTPDAGSILQQLQPAIPAASPSNRPSLQLEPKEANKLPPSAPFEVKTIRITGNTAFAAETLHALIADQEGRRLTLLQLEELAGRITAYYQNHGFPLARAIIPAQTITGGIVVIQVVEARYGAVRLDNRSQVNDGLLSSTIAPLHNGQVIAEQELDRALLLLSDVPGVSVNAVLKPGSDVGTSDLDVITTPVKTTFADLTADNYGNRYVGRPRLSGTTSIVNPFHHGDIFNATLVTTGSNMNYGRVSYDTLLNGLGTHAGGAYSLVHYKLGGDISFLGAHGTASVGSLWIKHPLMRNKQANIYAQFQYDAKQLRDRVDQGNTRTDRRLDNVVLSLNGDIRDSLLAGGISVWSLGWTSGRVGFDDANAQAIDASSTNTQGGFSKWNVNFSRLQGLTPKNSLYLNFAAQWADGNLDSAEKMTVGGPYTVRAYDIGAISADTGYFGTVELRHDLGSFAIGQWQAVAFLDSARVKVNRHPWSAGENSATLSGAGVGLTWTGPALWRASAYLATRIGATPSLVGSSNPVRAWTTLSKAF